MKEMTKISLLKSLLFGLITLNLIHPCSIFALAYNDSSKMVRFNSACKDDKCEDQYIGLTNEAKQLIINSRAALLKRKEIFSKKFKQFESIYHAANIMRMVEGNMFMYGPPGGAKSYFVNWLLGYEKELPFKIQMHQMMTEQVFVGGQDYEAAKRGTYVVNVKGSLADHKTAIIDEIDKGNPATLAALLSLLNERVVYLGGETFKSPLETIFSTSNKNLYEIYEEFARNGQGSTADALLNRFSCIVFVPNWLDEKDQLALDQEYLNNLNNAFSAKQEKIDEAALQLDWDGLRSLANALFVPTEELQLLARELVNKLRKESIDFIENHEGQDDKGVIPYYATVQYTERLRRKVMDVILMSLTLDLLTSSLTEDVDCLEATLKSTPGYRFAITPLSLWRAYPILTTVSYGETKLEIHNNGEFKASINFGDFLDNYKGENKRVNKMISYIKQERDIFKSALEEIWQKHQEAVKDASSSSAMFSCLQGNSNEFQDVERILLGNK
jgi:MoxR-like ATPase